MRCHGWGSILQQHDDAYVNLDTRVKNNDSVVFEMQRGERKEACDASNENEIC